MRQGQGQQQQQEQQPAEPASPLPEGWAKHGRHEGFLGKLSPKTGGGYQQRWFVLSKDSAALSYFKGKDARGIFTELDEDASGAYNPPIEWPQSPRIVFTAARRQNCRIHNGG